MYFGVPVGQRATIFLKNVVYFFNIVITVSVTVVGGFIDYNVCVKVTWMITDSNINIL